MNDLRAQEIKAMIIRWSGRVRRQDDNRLIKLVWEKAQEERATT